MVKMICVFTYSLLLPSYYGGSISCLPFIAQPATRVTYLLSCLFEYYSPSSSPPNLFLFSLLQFTSTLSFLSLLIYLPICLVFLSIFPLNLLHLVTTVSLFSPLPLKHLENGRIERENFGARRTSV